MEWSADGDRYITGRMPGRTSPCVITYPCPPDRWTAEGPGTRTVTAETRVAAVEAWLLSHPVTEMLGVLGDAVRVTALELEVHRLRGLLLAAGMDPGCQ